MSGHMIMLLPDRAPAHEPTLQIGQPCAHGLAAVVAGEVGIAARPSRPPAYSTVRVVASNAATFHSPTRDSKRTR